MKPFVLFDVGANLGTDSLKQTETNHNVIAYAFEPTPELVVNLRYKSRNFVTRYNIYPTAISNFDGQAEFNISAHADWGVSSLLSFNDDLEKTWPGRTDFYVDRKETVQVTRLDTWFKANNPPISQIDFFHCDTQGSDLAVLQGMGDFLGLIIEGVVETPHSEAVRLYKGQFTRSEMEQFLNDNGFEIFRVDHQQNEDNLYFRKIKKIGVELADN
jgi:FkbM family methyltransferase